MTKLKQVRTSPIHTATSNYKTKIQGITKVHNTAVHRKLR
jgi:hypothetical protein